MKSIDDYEKKEIFDYLDNLREVGVVNMYGSPLFVMSTFELTEAVATEVVQEWMDSYKEGAK